MYEGKYERPKHLSVRQRKATARRKRLCLLISLALVLGVGGTLAYIVTQTEGVTNIFNPSVVSTKVNETVSGNVKSNVTITNTGDTDAYIRAAIIINWVDKDGNIYGSVPAGCTTEPAELPETVEGWTKAGDYYYYNGVVPANGTTAADKPLISSIQPGDGVPEGYYLQVTILSSGVQATPDKAVEQAWQMRYADGTWTAVDGN